MEIITYHLSLLALVSVNVRASKEKSIPVFVTNDEKLWLLDYIGEADKLEESICQKKKWRQRMI